MEVKERIKELRIAAGLTQEELGERLGVQKSAIAKWENGRVKNIKAKHVAAMAELFGVAPSYVMAMESPQIGDDEMKKLDGNLYELDASEVDIIEAFNKLDDNRKNMLKMYIDLLVDSKGDD